MNDECLTKPLIMPNFNAKIEKSFSSMDIIESKLQSRMQLCMHVKPYLSNMARWKIQ